MTDGALRRSPLDAVHRSLGAKMVGFGGWEMPLSYPSGTVAEHLACRSAAVWFDVSHLGTVEVRGGDAFATLQHAATNDLRKITPGRAQYTHMCNDAGGVEDDVIIWWLSDDEFHVMPNASNTARILASIGGIDVTQERAVVAVQGPQARTAVATFAPELAAVGRFRVERTALWGMQCIVAGTGYTGEDGIEVALPVACASRLVAALESAGVGPAGLGARDTLRLEAALPLHGHEISPTISTLEAGLGWVIGWDKGEFVGRAALQSQSDAGLARRMVGIATDGRRPPRDGSTVVRDGRTIGVVTSGNYSPSLEHGIALALCADESVSIGDDVVVVVRGQELAGRAVATPFVGRR